MHYFCIFGKLFFFRKKIYGTYTKKHKLNCKTFEKSITFRDGVNETNKKLRLKGF